MNPHTKEFFGTIVAATAVFLSTPQMAKFVNIPIEAQTHSGTVTYYEYLSRYLYKENTPYLKKAGYASMSLLISPSSSLATRSIIYNVEKNKEDCNDKSSTFTCEKK